VGFYSLIFAVETASPRIQKVVKKNLRLEVVPPIIAEANRLGYFNRAFFIIGLPTDTVNDVHKSFDYALRLKLDSANFFMFTPLPGSSFFEEWIKNKNLDEIQWDFEFFSNPQSMVGFNNISQKELKKLQRYIYIKFYLLRPWKVVKHVIRYKLNQWDLLMNRIVYTLKFFMFGGKKDK
jgi:magnesium-protoporphyrin IX monomethyl ester (oxidative) cyclase